MKTKFSSSLRLNLFLAGLLSLLNSGPELSAASLLDRVQFVKTSTSQSGLKSIAFGDGQFVAVGAAGTILRSTNAQDFALQVSPTKKNLNSIAFGGGIFVAVGADGVVVRSSDGNHWDLQSAGPTALSNVTYGDGQYVATAIAGAILTSADGIAWTRHPLPLTSSFGGIAYGNGRFVAVSGTNAVVSTNALDWQVQATPTPTPLRGIVFGNGVFVVYGLPNGSIWLSEDGITWNSVNLGTYESPSVIGFGAGQFVALGNGTAVMLSNDGLVWTQFPTLIVPNFYITGPAQIAYGNGTFVAAGMSNTQNQFLLTSTDGMIWSSPSLMSSGSTFSDGVFAQGHFTLVGNFYLFQGGSFTENQETSAVANSTDTRLWALYPLNVQRQPTSIMYGGGRYLTLSALGVGSSIAVSTNAEDWTALGLNLPLFDATYIPDGGGAFLAVGDKGVISSSPDGYHWTRAASPTTNALRAVTAGAGRYVAVGDHGTIVSSVDMKAWMTNSSGGFQQLGSIAFGNGLFVTVGNNGTLLTSPDGVVWAKQRSGTPANLHHVIFANELFVVTGDGTVFFSIDGVNWTRSHAQEASNPAAIVYGNGKFLVSDFTGNLVADLAPGILQTKGVDATGALTFNLLGEIGGIYHLEAASSLRAADWTDVDTVTAAHLITTFSEPVTKLGGKHFFRTRLETH